MKNLAIFYGGKSAEHDISIITALQVLNNLDKQKYNIVPVYISNINTWHVLKDYEKINIYAKKSYEGKKLITGFYNQCLVQKTLFGFKKVAKIDQAINCCHGLNGEDGTLSGLLELAQIPYVGSGVVASGVGMDKVIMKDVFKSNNIPCVDYIFFTQKEYEINQSNIILEAELKLNYPIIVKPANLGSSIGINISKTREELENNIKIALSFDKKVILEQVVQNLREINCSCIGNYNSCETSILEEPKNWQTFLNFDEKYLSQAENKKTINVKIGNGIDEQIKALSKKVFQVLGCSGVVRIDFLLNDKTQEIYVNEINTIPGSYANYLWKHKYSFSQLLNKLLELSQDEYLYKNTNNYAFYSNVLQNYNLGQKNIKFTKIK
ncbi:MAG: D-alanine--D-alanine ligase [Clostridiales bacterium]|nr:D-alanine--D-alanine ligase [Clostridiales bacterium]